VRGDILDRQKPVEAISGLLTVRARSAPESRLCSLLDVLAGMLYT